MNCRHAVFSNAVRWLALGSDVVTPEYISVSISNVTYDTLSDYSVGSVYLAVTVRLSCRSNSASASASVATVFMNCPKS